MIRIGTIRRIAAVGVLVPLGGLAQAQDAVVRDTLTLQGFYAFDSNEGWGQTGGFVPSSYSPVVKNPASLTAPDVGRDLGTGWGGVGLEVLLKRSVRLPFLQAEGPLTSGNNLTLNLAAALSPVTLTTQAEAVLTPIAFLQFGLGAQAGTGWDLVVFNGLGRNLDPTGNIQKIPFGGLVFKGWAFGVFQFDLAALVPGEWNHVVLLSRVGLTFQALTAASGAEAWQWQADSGQNFNGWRLGSVHFLGYQMPLALNTLGLLLETDVYLEPVFGWSRIQDGGWGSDFLSLKPSLLTNWTLAEGSTLAILLGLTNFVDYSDATTFNRFYRHRSAEGVGWKLDRLSFQWNVKLSGP